MRQHLLCVLCAHIHSQNFRFSLFRAVVSTYQDPIPGWTNNLTGINGLCVGIGVGFLRHLHVNSDFVIDVICADYVINTTLAAIAYSAGEYIATKQIPSPEIYHVTSKGFKLTSGVYQRECVARQTLRSTKIFSIFLFFSIFRCRQIGHRFASNSEIRSIAFNEIDLLSIHHVHPLRMARYNFGDSVASHPRFPIGSIQHGQTHTSARHHTENPIDEKCHVVLHVENTLL